jgi:ABC-type Mn2+/Zn2+ transport system ATPase subunit
MFMLQIEHLFVSYDGNKNGSVLRGVDLLVNQKEKAVVVGPNGSGKSTLFKAVLGLAPVTSGVIKLFGTLSSKEHGDTRVSTNIVDVYRLVYLPARDLVKIFAELKGKSPDFAFKLFREFELNSILGKRLHELSTGQQKMFGNIMAVSFDPKLVLLDEPFDNVDENRRRRLIDVLNRLDSEIVIITHEFNLLSRLGDWGLYFMLEGKLWGRFSASQLDRLYISRGDISRAIKVMDTSLGKLSVTLDYGDVAVKTASNVNALLEKV